AVVTLDLRQAHAAVQEEGDVALVAELEVLVERCGEVPLGFVDNGYLLARGAPERTGGEASQDRLEVRHGRDQPLQLVQGRAADEEGASVRAGAEGSPYPI